MIVELFGPPGVGKTTFASGLADLLRAHGHAVDPVMSYRPAEQTPATSGLAKPSAPGKPSAPSKQSHRSIASARRLTRPVAELLATTGHLLSHPNDVAATTELMRLLPARNLVWSIRLRQYLFRLFRAWDLAAASPYVVLFDQAFVQAVCSLALLSRVPGGARIGRALDAVPEADLLIQLDAPRDVLAARLGQRQQHQGTVERLLELDLQTNLASVGIIDDMQALLRSRGRPVTRLECTDPPTLRASLAKAGEDILARLEAQRPAQPGPGRQTTQRPHHA